MTPEMSLKLRASLIKHEEKKNFPYVDTVGKITIGIGYNLTDRGLPDTWINNQYNEDVEYFYSKFNEFPWFKDFNLDRQIILLDMSFMGWQRFLGFTKLIENASIHNYDGVAYEIENSEWAEKVGNRAKQLAEGMRSGTYTI